MKPDHKAALNCATGGHYYTKELDNLAAAYLDLREKAKAALAVSDVRSIAEDALREILEEK